MLSLLTAALLGATFRVETNSGVPQIVVDGRPVRARMFWGGVTPTPLAIGPQGRRVEFEFVGQASAAGTATIHFRFGPTPGDVWMDDVAITDLDAQRDVLPRCDFESGPESFGREWTFWPQGPANTVGTVTVEPGVGRDGTAGLHVRLKAPPGASGSGGRWPDFHIYHQPRLSIEKGKHYRVSFWARSEPARGLTVGLYRPGPTFVPLGGPNPPYSSLAFASQIRLAAAAGVNFVSFPVQLPWPEPGQPTDWATPDGQCQAVLDANPQAWLLPRIGVEPPLWWRKAHPDDMMRWEDGLHELTDTAAAPASQLFRREAAAQLSALIAHLEAKFGPHLAGYHPTGQNTGEWFYHDTWKRPLSGYAPVELAAWHKWLGRRYVEDAALRRAWNAADVTCATAPLPTPAARRSAPAGVLRDPQHEQALLDFNEFQQEMMADEVCDLARAVRQATAGRKLVVFFYGYMFEFGAVRNGPAVAGHYALRQVLASPDIDVLCSPISYFDRALGGGAPSMSAAESVALAGKLWLNEDDTSTHLSSGTQPGHKERTHTLDDTNALLVRNVAQEALRNFGTWWMDLGSTGWFNDSGMWAEMARLRALDEPLLQHPLPYRPDVAVVVDPAGMLDVSGQGWPVTLEGVYKARAELGRMGAPYGQYLLDDVLAGRVRAKLYVMLTAWRLSAQQRQQLRRAIGGADVVWCYAPGYVDADHFSLDAMKELTGFRLKKVSPAKALAEPTDFGRDLKITRPLGVAGHVEPLFAVDDRGAVVIAQYSDGSTAVTAALSRSSHGRSWFVGTPGLSSELLRVAAKAAGVHLYTQTDCNVYANGPYVAVHTAHEGPLMLDFGRPGRVVDLLTGRTLGQGPIVTLPLPAGRTAVMELEAEHK